MPLQIGDSLVYAIVGEPGLMPGQGDGPTKLRNAVISADGSLGISRGYHAVGCEIRGIKEIRCEQGKDHPLAQLPVGSAAVTAHAAIAGRSPDGEPGWRDLAARILGVKLDQIGDRGTYPVPLHSDPSSLTVAVKLANGQIWPRFSGVVKRIDRVQDVDGHDVVVFHGQSYNFWLRDGGLNPLYLEELDRKFDEQDAATRMHTILNRVGYLHSDASAVYHHRAQSDLGAWDRFGPSRLRQGFGHAAGTTVPELTAAGQNVQRLLDDTAFVAGGSLVMHQGIGPIRIEGPATGPDRLHDKPELISVTGDAILPAADYQADFGGVLSFLKWGIDPETDLFTSGGFETPIKLTGADTDDDWTGSWRGRPAKTDSDLMFNTCVWSAAGDPVPTTYILDTGHGGTVTAQETRRSHRKFGLNEHVRTGLPFMARDKMQELAQRFLGTWITPRPSFDLACVIPPDDPGDHHRVAAALANGHDFGYVDAGGEWPMHCLRTIDRFKPGEWQKVVTCSAAKVDVGPIGLRPEMPTAYFLDLRTVEDTGGPVPPPTLPTADPDQRRFADDDDPLTAQPLAYPRHGPRVVFVAGAPLVWWTWQPHLGDLPLTGWRVEARLIPDQGAEPDIPDFVITHPWQTWHRFANPAAGTEGRWPLGTWRIKVTALTRVSGNSWRGDNPSSTVEASSSDIAPPGPPRDVTAYRPPDSVAVNMVWRPPENQGGAEITHYAVYRDGDFTAPVAGHDNIDAANPTRVIVNRLWPGNHRGAVVYHVVAFNGTTAAPGLRAATIAIPEEPNADGLGPPADTPEPVMGPFTAVRTAAGVTVLWDEYRPGSGADQTGQNGSTTNWELSRVLLEFTQGTRTWTRTLGLASVDGTDTPAVQDPSQPGNWWRAGYLSGVREEPYDDDFTEDQPVSIRMRVRGSVAGTPRLLSAWTDPLVVPPPEPPTVPRDLAVFRQSETREASDGYGLVWAAPSGPGDRPAARVDRPGGPGTADRAFADSDTYGRYEITPDPGAAAVKGFGNRLLTVDESRRRPVELDVAAKAGTALGPIAELNLGEVRGMGFPRDLIVGRHSPGSGRVRWVASMPQLPGDGQPSKYRSRPAGGTWVEDDFNVTNPPARERVPELTVGTGAATIEVQYATATGEWSLASTAAVPAVRTPGRSTDNRPRNVRTGWWDALPLATTPIPTGGAANQKFTGWTDDDAVTLAIFWEEPMLTTNGLRASSYLVTVKVAYGRGRYLYKTTEGVLCHYETGNNLLYALIPISDDYFFGGSPYWEHPDRPGVWGPFFRLAIHAQYETGVRNDGWPTRPLSNNAQYLGYHRMPTRPPIKL